MLEPKETRLWEAAGIDRFPYRVEAAAGKQPELEISARATALRDVTEGIYSLKEKLRIESDVFSDKHVRDCRFMTAPPIGAFGGQEGDVDDAAMADPEQPQVVETSERHEFS